MMIFITYEKRNEDSYFYWYWILLVINIMFSIYFFANEFRQLLKEGLGYLSSFWNYIDLIPPIGIFIICGFSIVEFLESQVNDPSNPQENYHLFGEEFKRTVLALTTLFMWFKFLYFFRIFKPTGYLIRMIVTVVVDMRYFLIVLLVTILGFGNAFLVISLGNTDEKNIFTTDFIDSFFYTYRMVLGDFATDEFGEVATPLIWLLFLFFTVFNMIVMLNLLIAIISDSYAGVVQNAE
jgi:hypothetical protein